MEKKILIVGCSFSHKVWDADGDVHQCWSDCITNELGDKIYVTNLSMPGASNELIKRIVTKKVLEENWDHVIIQWSTIDRWDYPIQHIEHNQFVRYWPNGTNLEGEYEYFYKHY
jgi:hypothetical protein